MECPRCQYANDAGAEGERKHRLFTAVGATARTARVASELGA